MQGMHNNDDDLPVMSMCMPLCTFWYLLKVTFDRQGVVSVSVISDN